VAHTCNPSYSGGRDQEDHSSKPTQANSLQDPILKNPSQKIGLVEWLKVKALSSSPSTAKKSHFILIKGAIYQEEIIIINLYVPNVSAPNFIKNTLKDLKPHIYPSTVVVGDFLTPLSTIDRSSRQKNQQRSPRNK
jgi:hypothetical protein